MTRPIVMLIDDSPQSAALPDDLELILLNPEDANFSSDLETGLKRADLILLDQNLHQDQVLSLTALDGAGFVGNLRSWARANDLPLPPIVIYTSEHEAFADEVPALGPAVPLSGSFIGREAGIAPALDVEWLIPKDEPFSVAHIKSLARDSLSLRVAAQDSRMSLQEISDFLAIPRDPPWFEIAMSQLTKWRPPINEAGDAHASSRGATPVLRWLLHRVLPCPGLLLSDLYAAWTLAIDPADFIRICEEPSEHEWVQALCAAQYSGAGKDLAGRRWWAAGIDFMGWRLRDRAHSLGDFQRALEELAGSGVRPLVGDESVVVVNVDLEEVGLASIDNAVQIHPPGWASEAVDPWMLREDVDADPIAMTMVDPMELLDGS